MYRKEARPIAIIEKKKIKKVIFTSDIDLGPPVKSRIINIATCIGRCHKYVEYVNDRSKL